MKKIWIGFLGCLLLNTYFLSAQTIWHSIPQRSINLDSIFEIFIPPDIPEYLLDSAGSFQEFTLSSFEVICFVGVNEEQKVRSIKLVPVFGYGNNIVDSNIIWVNLLQSIDSVSKYWKFKPLLYQIKDEYPNELKDYYKNINQKVLLGEKTKGRPLYGNQYHVIYLSIQMPYDYSDSAPDFIYHLNINAKKNWHEDNEQQNLYKQILKEDNPNIPSTIIEQMKAKQKKE